MASGSHPACPSWFLFHLHWDTHQSALEASLPAHLAFVPVGWCLVPVCCLDVAKGDIGRLSPCKQPKCAPALWHSCLVQKENRAGKANTAGSLSGSIPLPLIFSWCAEFCLEETNRGWNTARECKVVLAFHVARRIGTMWQRARNFMLWISAPHPEEHCAAAKEKLIKDYFSFGTTSSKCWWKETIMKDLYQFLKI